jgi:hypothetical protein
MLIVVESMYKDNFFKHYYYCCIQKLPNTGHDEPNPAIKYSPSTSTSEQVLIGILKMCNKGANENPQGTGNA